MNTPWGEIAVSDAHVHFLSDRFFEVLAHQKGSPVAGELSAIGIEAPEADPEALGRRWAEELDHHGVASAALIASVPRDEASVWCAVRLCPQRFHGYFVLDPTQPGAVERAESALDKGMQGVCFFPAMHGYSIQDERAKAVLAGMSARTGVLAFVHCGVLSVGIRGRLGLSSRFDMRFSNPADLHGVALEFPNLPFVVPHFGAGYFREALMLCDLCPNVHLDTSSSNGWVKYQWPEMHVRDAFRMALALAGPRRLLFGTDSSFFPRGWHRGIFDTQVGLLSGLGMSAADAELVFGGNLRRLLSR